MKKFLATLATFGIFALVIMVIAMAFDPGLVHAQATTAATQDTTKDMLAAVQEILTKGLDVLLIIFWPILLLIGGLMNNDIILGAGMQERLLAIWVIIRNFVNIAFVIVLVAAALYSVLGIGGDEGGFAIKKVLPKVIIGLILVNFSFFFCKVILDATNVLTTAFAGIPGQVDSRYNNILAMEFKNENGEDINIEAAICRGTQKTAAHLRQGGTLRRETGILDWCNGDQLKESLEVPDYAAAAGQGEATMQFALRDFFTKYGSHNAAFALAANFMKISEQRFAVPELTTVEELFKNTIFSIVMFLIFGTTIVALFIVLLARAVVLWVVIALSPAAIFLMLFKDQLGFLGTGEADLQEKFVQHAIAPATISLVMSIGFLMVDAFKGSNLGPGLGGVTIAAPSPGSAPIKGFVFLQDLLIAVAAVGIVWMGVFAAAKKTIAQGVLGTIESTVGGGLKWAATAPFKYIRWIPTKGPKGETSASPMAFMAGLQQFKYKVESGPRETAQELWPQLYETGDKEAVEALRKAGGNASQIQAAIQAHYEVIPHSRQAQELIAKNLKFKPKAEQYRKLLEEGKLTGDQLKNFYQAQWDRPLVPSAGGAGGGAAGAGAAAGGAQPPTPDAVGSEATPAGAYDKYKGQGVTKDLAQAVKNLDAGVRQAWGSFKTGADGKVDSAANTTFARALFDAQEKLKKRTATAGDIDTLARSHGSFMTPDIWSALQGMTSDAAIKAHIESKNPPPPAPPAAPSATPPSPPSAAPPTPPPAGAPPASPI